ncbi:DUF6086 family protein [Nocardia tengchongensis]|uniref:DUF6086 family protein n=1 Tax=Nocardia tengchongensis TaxID=2055889 RepID=UPI003677698F
MSQYYELDDATLWNPSNGVSRLFLGQVRLFEDELGVASGIGPMEADACEVVPAQLGRFVDALLDWRGRTNHVVIQAFSDGFIATMLVLAERANVELDRNMSAPNTVEGMHDLQASSIPLPRSGEAPGWSVAVHEHAHQLARFMLR